MKIALINDTHFGVRNDNQFLHDYFEKFYSDIFFPYLKKHKITTVIHLGDLVDRRKYININTAKRMRENFLEQLPNTYIIAGNHDVYYKNSNEVNALSELCQSYPDSMWSFTEPYELELDGTKMLLVPWICDANREKTFEAIKNTTAQVCFGHLEINGFEMHRGEFCDHGIDEFTFNKFDMVLSGHFHHKSTRGNIHYLGSPYEMTWGDYGDEKGFHVFDTKTHELQFIKNPYKIFEKIIYSDLNKTVDYVKNSNLDKYKNCFVKVIVKEKTNPYIFDMFIDTLEKIGVNNLQIVEDSWNINLDADDEILSQAEDTITILKKYISSIGIEDKHKTKLENLFRELYTEANMIEQ